MIKTAALIALGFASAMAFVKSTMPMDREPQAVREAPAADAPDDDIPARPHPNWKLMDEQWDGHFERPEPTPEHVRVWCKKNPDYCKRIAK